MELNATRPDLPSWPKIQQIGKDEYMVEGRHVSYGRYMFLYWVVRLASLVGLYLLAKHFYGHMRHYYWQDATLMFGACLAIYAIFVRLVPVPRVLFWLFFRRKTQVSFSPETIVVNGRGLSLIASINVQFRASRYRLKEDQIARYPKIADYLARFRVIEMVYGHSVVPIASIDNEDRAGQFAVALQCAYDMVRTPARIVPQAPTPFAYADSDLLPE